MTKIMIFSSAKQLTQAAVTCFVELAQQSIAKQDGFAVALSGGSTPRSIYQELAKSEHQTFLNWEKIHLFWGDERHVPLDDPESNYKMVKDALLKHIEIPKENIHRVPAEKTVHEAAYLYEADLRQFFVEDWPRFDLVLLGMGGDGHTASLFPRSAGLNEEQRWFIANRAPKLEKWRLTLTKHAINAARNVIVLVQGASKANMMAEVLVGPYSPEEKPIQLISLVNGEMIWMVDADAAKALPEEVLLNAKYFTSFER